MSKSETSREKKVHELRNKIAEAAIYLFLNNGFDQTTVEDIAKKSGVSRRSIFRHFESKDEIALFWTNLTKPTLLEQFIQDENFIKMEPVQVALNAVIRHVNQHKDLLTISLAVGKLINNTPALRARHNEKYLNWEDSIADVLIQKGIDPMAGRMAAAVAMSGLRIAAREWLVCESQKSLIELLENVYQPYLNINQTK